MVKKLDNLAMFFLVVGGIVWGMIGLYDLNLVEYVFDRSWVIRILYVLFGLGFVYTAIAWYGNSKSKRKTKS